MSVALSMETANVERLRAALIDRYRVERELGAGGMATVFLAQDLKHDRKVALKVLKPELAAVLGAERFVVEIKTTAALQHPHILPLFDSGSADGFLFYVMPFIDGETLRTKLTRETQLDVDEALRITRDVGEALDYAHRHGVIHRDIKPENILVHDGRPMVADFGIALAVSAAAGGRMTETGLSLGTPHYMSPEQATADKDITARSDVYSLASVLYEMLSGAPPHTGASAQQIIMKIITETPQPVTALRKSVPPNVAAAIARALEKVPADRFPSARAFLDALASPSFGTTTAVGIQTSSRAGGRRSLVALGVVAALALAAAALGWLRPEPPQPLRRLDLSFGPAVPVTNNDVAISPDGSLLAYAGQAAGSTPPAIWLRRLDGDADFHMLTGTEGGLQPAFSPDNQWIVFRKQGADAATLAKVAVSGGGAITVSPLSSAYFPHWGTPDKIVFSGPPGTFVIPPDGGTPEKVPNATVVRPFLLPDGSGVLGLQDGNVVLHELPSGTMKVLVRGGRNAMYVPTGHLLYVSDDGALFAVGFDLRGHRVVGQAHRVLDRVAWSISARGFDVSANGTLVQHDAPPVGTGGSNSRFVIGRIGGKMDTLPLPSGRRFQARFSPNGRVIAYSQITGRGIVDRDIYTYDLVTSTTTQVTFALNNVAPIWSPDGTRLLYQKDSTGGSGRLWIQPADNSSAGEALDSVASTHVPSDWPRPDLIAFYANPSGNNDIFTMAPKRGEKAQPYLRAPWDERDMMLSPDGQLAVFTSREFGNNDVWLRDFPTPTGKWRVSPNGGQSARWSRDGRYIYFWRSALAPTADTLFRVRIDRKPQLVVRAPEIVAKIDVNGVANWDLHPDGTRFIATVADAPATPAPSSTPTSRYLVVVNWFSELKSAFATRK